MEKLTAKQSKAVEKLLEGRSITAAALECGIGRKTLQRWLGLNEFQAALKAGSDGAIHLAAVRLAAMVDASLTAIEEIIASPTTAGAAIRLRAADALLGHALKLRENVELSEQVAELERRLNDTTKQAYPTGKESRPTR